MFDNQFYQAYAISLNGLFIMPITTTSLRRSEQPWPAGMALRCSAM